MGAEGEHDLMRRGWEALAEAGWAVSRCEGGRIAEECEIADTLGLLGQVGALPEMAQS